MLRTHLCALAALILGVPAMALAIPHPCLYETPADIQRARENIQRYDWAKRCWKGIQTEADQWAAKSDAELREILPPKKSIYAYGFSGCPLCKKSWPTWGGGGVGDLSRPGTAKCPQCGHIFPDAEHPDTGRGWVDPETGKKYYFVGCANAYVAQQVTLNILDNLASAYVISGDEKYARAGATLMDALASLYPSDKTGSIDYPGADGPDGMGGRLERPQYQVARVLVFLARYYDLLYNSPEMDRPSIEPGMKSIRQNIEQNMIEDGADYCWKIGTDLHMGLTNGQADYVRGVIAAGLLLGKDDYLKWALEGPTSVSRFLDNNLDRDGLYYETSTLYSEHAIHLYVDMADMLINYHSAKYPEGLNLFQHPKLSRAMVDALMEMNCAGHLTCIGDSSPDLRVVKDPEWLAPGSYAYFFAEHLYSHAKGQEAEQWWQILERLCGGDVAGYRNEQKKDDALKWLLFHAAAPLSEKQEPKPFAMDSKLMGGKGIALLRSGVGSDSRAALMRFGPTLNHGQYDELGINLYALGREITYDLGYGLGSAHVYQGWSKHTASHNLVVVNEKSQLADGISGTDPHLFADFAGLEIAEAGSGRPYHSERIKDYRRTLALVDLGPGNFYLLDLFRVIGGSSHDQSTHFQGTLEEPEGVALSAVEETGSLAGPEYNWGTRVGPDGDATGKDAGGIYWNAPPGNGYGFLHHLRRGKAGEAVRLSWKLDDSSRVRATLLAPPDTELVTAKAPGILPALPSADYAFLRRKGGSLASAFATLIEPTAGESAIESIERMKPERSEADAIGVHVRAKGGRQDYILSTTDAPEAQRSRVFQTADQEIAFTGQFGYLSADNSGTRQAVIMGGSRLLTPELEIRAEAPGYSGILEAVDYQKAKLKTSAKLPEGALLAGQMIYFQRDSYPFKAPYALAKAASCETGSELDLGDMSLVLGCGITAEGDRSDPHMLPNKVPLEQGTSMPGKESGFFDGKLILNERTGKATTVMGMGTRRSPDIRVQDASIFEAGDPYVIYDLQPGDAFFIPSRIELRAQEGKYRLINNIPVEIRLGSIRRHFEPGEHLIEAPAGL